MNEAIANKGLGQIEGLCACYSKKTLNGRGYENIFKRILRGEDYRFNEMMRRGGILCEFGHPSQYTADFERTETDPEKACVIITSIEEKENGKIYAKATILDTPAGRTYKAIAPFYTFGFSSRGSYEVDEDSDEGPDGWNEDSYVFKGFDIVALPANEGSEISAVESLGTKKKRKTARESLDLQNIASAANLDPKEVDAELDKLFNKDGGLDAVELIDAKTFADTTSTTGTTKDNSILLDLHKVLVDKNELEKQVQKLLFEKAESDASIASLTSQLEDLKAIQADAEQKLKFFRENREEIQSLLDKLIQTHDSQISEATTEIKEKDERIQSLAAQVASLSNKVAASADIEHQLADATANAAQQEERADAAEEALKKAKEENASLTQEIDDTKNNLVAAKEELSSLKTKLAAEQKKSASYAKIAVAARESLVDLYSTVYSIDRRALKAKIGNTGDMNVVRSAAESLSRDAQKFAAYPVAPVSHKKAVESTQSAPFAINDDIDKELLEALKKEGRA